MSLPLQIKAEDGTPIGLATIGTVKFGSPIFNSQSQHIGYLVECEAWREAKSRIRLLGGGNIEVADSTLVYAPMLMTTDSSKLIGIFQFVGGVFA